MDTELSIKEAEKAADQVADQPVILRDNLSYEQACKADAAGCAEYGIYLEVIRKPKEKDSAVLAGHKSADGESGKNQPVLRNPRSVADKTGTMEAGRKVTWDCVWFGP